MRIRAKKNKQNERLRYLEKEVNKLYEIVREQNHRIVQLEIIRKLGN